MTTLAPHNLNIPRDLESQITESHIQIHDDGLGNQNSNLSDFDSTNHNTTSSAPFVPLSNNSARSSVVDTSVDPYKRDKSMNPVSYFWYRYINPIVRFALVIPVLLWYVWLANLATQRTNKYLYETRTISLSGSAQTPEYTWPLNYGVGGFNPNDHLGDSNYNVLNRPWVLPDVLHQWIPAATSASYSMWVSFSDASLEIFFAIVILGLIFRRDIIRTTELLSMIIIMFFVKGLVNVTTTYPDANQVEAGCYDPAFRDAGSWIFTHISTTHSCGTQMWSGHVANCLLALIMIRRLLWDTVGWNFQWSLEKQAAEVPTYGHGLPQTHTGGAHSEQVLSRQRNDNGNLSYAGAGIDQNYIVENNESDFWFHQHRTPQTQPSYNFVNRHHTLTYFTILAIRIILPAWFILVLISRVVTRNHYTTDIIIAIFIQILVATHSAMLQSMVRFLYRPYYHNYVSSSPLKPMRLVGKLNPEQANLEDRIERVGRGGAFF